MKGFLGIVKSSKWRKKCIKMVDRSDMLVRWVYRAFEGRQSVKEWKGMNRSREGLEWGWESGIDRLVKCVGLSECRAQCMDVNARNYRWSESRSKVCQMCDMGEDETVEHVVLECDKYDRDRMEMMRDSDWNGTWNEWSYWKKLEGNGWCCCWDCVKRRVNGWLTRWSYEEHQQSRWQPLHNKQGKVL